MTDTTADAIAPLKALRDRLRAASGSDRELDARVLIALIPDQWRADAYDVELGFAVEHAEGRAFRKVRVPQFTASIDAALALCERTLPGAYWRVEKSPPALAAAHGQPFWATCGAAGQQEAATGPTAPLAILLALLEAMIGKETG